MAALQKLLQVIVVITPLYFKSIFQLNILEIKSFDRFFSIKWELGLFFMCRLFFLVFLRLSSTVNSLYWYMSKKFI